ncbi:PREDICTED: uncharacterized protein LOC106300097 [Brassica oleracea var. oleracea]|uniref:Zinc finger PHD-type domain-containing protein n=1 Tax=Brassica oleracea var. oleracea TaxID=109376 RepID=A0A0D3CPH7_BRAOL|nr:PREDICTED: uncharacterized protein LOC106300097 [Brassica oleracea var. oleracea]XP_013591626.1 PREDICTED: uncharacterized protein LOC106300097 [Brassica oleracea var. oleracea]
MANVCETCGDEGWVEALIFCDSCKLAAVHRYCCGITPVPIDGYVTWFCSDCDESDTASDSIQVELEDVESLDVSSSPPTMEEHETRGIPGSSKSNESVLEMIGNEKKKKRKIVTHSLPDDAIVETMEVSKKQDGSENGESDELIGLARNESSVLEKSGKKKKKKKKTTDKGVDKKNEEGSNHFSPVLEAEGHGLQVTTSVEPMKESKKRKCSKSREPEGLNVLVGNEVSVLEKSAKKKRSQESSNHPSPVLNAVECGHQDTASVEAMKESKKHKKSDELIGEKSEKKKKKTNEESSNHTAPVLAAKDNVACDTDNVEPAKAQESSASRKPHELAGLETNGASVSEGGNSTNVPDDNSCTTSKKRRLSSGNIQVTSENMELPAINSSCKEAESNMPQTNEVMPALNNGRAQPICAPVWRGSVTVKQGNNCSIHGLVAHLSTLACPRVYEKASSLHTRLSAEMLPRLEIWPPSFLKNGPPTDDSIALYFFPSHDSNGENVYYSLVDEMKKKDLGMRCLLDDAELLLFTSYQLPLPCWKFHSKEYLWGVFRRRKTSGHKSLGSNL